MNRCVLFGMAAVLALYGCGRGTASEGAGTATATDSGGTPVTIVGCLVPGTASQGTPVGASGSTSARGFSLIDVTATSTASDAGAPTGVSGTAGTSAAPQVDTGQPRSYELVGDKPDDLQKYQNSSVEVTGLLIPPTDTGAGVPGVRGTSAPAGVPAANVQRVRVQRVRQLEKTCR